MKGILEEFMSKFKKRYPIKIEEVKDNPYNLNPYIILHSKLLVQLRKSDLWVPVNFYITVSQGSDRNPDEVDVVEMKTEVAIKDLEKKIDTVVKGKVYNSEDYKAEYYSGALLVKVVNEWESLEKDAKEYSTKENPITHRFISHRKKVFLLSGKWKDYSDVMENGELKPEWAGKVKTGVF